MKVLMVSTEYPPMLGGVGRYTSNLVKALRKAGAEVVVACSEKGNGDYTGLSPTNANNSELLLQIAEESAPDVVHVQFEPGLYGLAMDLANPRKKGGMTYIDTFYKKCRFPIVTTFHSAYTFKDWMGQSTAVKPGRYGTLGVPARIAVRTWRNIVHYRSYSEINREKLALSRAGICFSRYAADQLGGGHIIYHGAEPASAALSKEEARRRFSLPPDRRIALVTGFRTVTKGWDIVVKMKVPPGWVIVSNSAKSHFSRENMENVFEADGIIDLQRGYLSDEELSSLMFASDAVLLPYRITSGSGVMFDALAHGLPFVASDLAFFREFAEMGLGITAKRDPESFARAIETIGHSYDKYSRAAQAFKEKLRWDFVARQHVQIYSGSAALGDQSFAV
ncbi:MAG: glycosyltransferase family 4 protein [Nitrososphaera sp.]|jgi:glycosyltransferase involved in cell wall biosynthesis